jgi:nucleotide-binding universal stress UspA family protein
MPSGNILVALDGSDNALRALKHAASLAAKDRTAKLLLLYVHQPIPRSRAISQALIEEHYARQEELALAKTKSYLARNKLRAGIEICIGDPATTIVEYARKKKCKQIVLGNHGHGAIAGVLLGSVAMKVIQLADVPVTLVK